MDINALKERLQQLNRRTNKPNDIWKPRDEHEVRCLPYPHGPDPFIELHFHYEVGDNPSILCPKMNFGNDCAVCDFADQLKSWKDPSGRDKPDAERKIDWDLFKRIQAKARVFVPMVERGRESDGPKFWGVTPNQALQILEVCADGDRLEELGIDRDDTKRALEVVTSPDRGYDLKVSFRKAGEKGNTKTFPEVTIKGAIKAKSLSKEKTQMQELLSSVKNIREVYPEVSSNEVHQMLTRFINGSRPEEESSKSKESLEKYETNSSERADRKGGQSIDDAFRDILD